ncbi:MAG: hypothetical protein AAF685_01400 [Cyanobacteria bacterium P01_C01_bin.89]
MEWKSHLPVNCPPPEADFYTGTIYRLLKPPIAEKSFLSLRERNPHKEYKDPKVECLAGGLSIHLDKQDALNLKRRIPKFKKFKVGQATLNSGVGKLLSTPSKNEPSHCTLWPYRPVMLAPVFKFVS